MGLPCNCRVSNSKILVLQLCGRWFGDCVALSVVSLVVSGFDCRCCDMCVSHG